MMERRTVLKAAAAAPVLLWVTPVVETLVPSNAYADRHSAAPKPRNPGRVESSQLPTPTPAETEPVSDAQLPFTGDAERNEAALAALLIASGVAAVVATREPRTL